jgi:hypothetical protein
MTKPLLDDAGFVFRTPTPDDYRFVIHNNGPNRKRKVMIKTPHGIFSARRYMYKVYHPEWDMKGKIIHLDNDDLNFHPDNLICVTDRVANNLVHFNNHYISPSPTLTRDVIKLIEAQIKFKEVTKNDD